MLITDVIPEGGYQDPHAFADESSKQSPRRCPPFHMDMGTFLSLCREHIHPRFQNIVVLYSEAMNKVREDSAMGTGRCATLVFAGGNYKEEGPVIPCDGFPYTSIRTKEWDQDRGGWCLSGEQRKGWRKTLQDLVVNGMLKESRELDWWIGRDTFKLAPKEYRM